MPYTISPPISLSSMNVPNSLSKMMRVPERNDQSRVMHRLYLHNFCRCIFDFVRGELCDDLQFVSLGFHGLTWRVEDQLHRPW